MADFGERWFTIAQFVAYFIALLLIIQLLRKIFGGSWAIEDIILALVILNLTLTFSISSYLIHINTKIAKVEHKVYGHLEWHRGKEHKPKLKLTGLVRNSRRS